MAVGSYLELYLAVVGWQLYDGLWQSLADAELVYIPFIVMATRAKTEPGSRIVKGLQKGA